MTDTIFVLNGPNLNLLGTREPRIYGTNTLADITAMLEQRAKALKLQLDVRQSNHEGELVDWLHESMAKASAVIINGGGYAHTSIAIRDAVAALPIPVVEVHLSNVYAREGFRRQSMIAQVARGSIVGFGPLSYMLALDAASHLCKGAGATQAKSQIQ
ncbi:type II 3-dehydroquinate dehydratase [Sphingomonas hankyongi]|uniref:3-dehydroquinate dehydratase n=1 Tax=Sphingomonas hankyongi TaxID=2908209 RepID=A0ABT0S0D9_9SPHN|nr:type II 3-dehydroquinate dehydratase [Sphingomonas hankyongi]MCL6729096.1 type II 3-dehydroquinate dehydratase [Sphingomonas hankyongi]